MKVSLRSIISNAVVAGIVLASMPMVAMEQGAQQQQQQQSQQKNENKGSIIGDGIRSFIGKAEEYQNSYIPDFAKGADNFSAKADDGLRAFAKSAMGPIAFAAAGLTIGLFVCHYLMEDKTGVSILDQFFGFFKGLYGEEAFNKKADTGFEAVQKNDGFKGVVQAAQLAHTAKQNGNQLKEQLNKGASWFDELSAKIISPIANTLKDGLNWVAGSSEKKNDGTQQPEQQSTSANSQPEQPNQNSKQQKQNTKNTQPQSSEQSAPNQNESQKVDKKTGVLNMKFDQETKKESKKESQNTNTQN